ncbi:MAG: hypothetical protein HC945_00755 [Nitrosarchaeum sp.]|nr:hypothetical protein [Nitrosarchaeum sp.]
MNTQSPSITDKIIPLVRRPGQASAAHLAVRKAPSGPDEDRWQVTLIYQHHPRSLVYLFAGLEVKDSCLGGVAREEALELLDTIDGEEQFWFIRGDHVPGTTRYTPALHKDIERLLPYRLRYAARHDRSRHDNLY